MFQTCFVFSKFWWDKENVYSSTNIFRVIKSRRIRWAGYVARMGEERGEPEGKRPLGRPRRRWVDNIRMDLHEVGCGYMDWIGLAQDRDRWRTLVSAVMNLRVPWNAGNCLTSCKPDSFSRRTLHHGVSKYYVAGGGGDVYEGFWWGNPRERGNLRDPGVDGRIILRCIFKKWKVRGMDWFELAKDSDWWRALVNMVMNFRVP